MPISANIGVFHRSGCTPCDGLRQHQRDHITGVIDAIAGLPIPVFVTVLPAMLARPLRAVLEDSVLYMAHSRATTCALKVDWLHDIRNAV